MKKVQVKIKRVDIPSPRAILSRNGQISKDGRRAQ